MSDSPRPEENIFSEFAKLVVGTQLDEFRKVAVSARTNLVKLFQGEVENISFAGRNIVKDEIQVQEVEVQADQISVDPLSILLGKIRLSEPIDSHIRLVLSEDNLNRNMNSDYVKGFLQPIELNVEGKTVFLELKPPFSLRLLSNNRMRFTGDAIIRSARNIQTIGFSAVVCPRTEIEPIKMESFYCTPNDGQSIPLMIALMQWMQTLVSQPYLEFAGIAFQVKLLSIQNKELTTEIEIHASQMPTL
ncbi:DUF2993 domain-containing protein [Cyanobacteria bacterium FACHB-DQ100]|uniref:LmeA family phospholipid-binding protein n=1 Tax=Leptolyngbya sp. DQ-M1 TaxID=2933920 RepID=UPI0019954BBE|nr:DUF2993 domain-containing protein [Cyanobacteria bacterium FACHB-DQ100]